VFLYDTAAVHMTAIRTFSSVFFECSDAMKLTERVPGVIGLVEDD
jgi:hypothetical protein